MPIYETASPDPICISFWITLAQHSISNRYIIHFTLFFMKWLCGPHIYMARLFKYIIIYFIEYLNTIFVVCYYDTLVIDTKYYTK
jgi:hypothetical protein